MTRQQVIEVLTEVNKMFADQMARLPVKKKALEDMKAGFSDGARMTVHLLKDKGYLKVDD